jgi:hypothetical protein
MAQLKLCPFKAASFFPPVKSLPKMEREEYFRVDREWIRVDGRSAADQASCCGVNLAFAGLEGFFLRL